MKIDVFTDTVVSSRGLVLDSVLFPILSLIIWTINMGGNNSAHIKVNLSNC